MEHLKHYFDYLAAFDTAEIRSVDRCHNIFLIGSVLSKKPRNILELGIGTGSLTVSMIYALRYNGARSRQVLMRFVTAVSRWWHP